MAWKHFSDAVWQAWLTDYRQRLATGLWDDAWSHFMKDRDSVEAERNGLFRRRIHDEFWYADEFGMAWPPYFEAAVSRAAEHRQRLRKRLHEEWRNSGRDLDGNAVGSAKLRDGTTLTISLRVSDRMWGGPYVEDAAYRYPENGSVAVLAGLLLTIVNGRTVETVSNLEPADLLRRLGAGVEESAEATAVIEAFRRALSAVVTGVGKCDTRTAVGPAWEDGAEVLVDLERN